MQALLSWLGTLSSRKLNIKRCVVFERLCHVDYLVNWSHIIELPRLIVHSRLTFYSSESRMYVHTKVHHQHQWLPYHSKGGHRAPRHPRKSLFSFFLHNYPMISLRRGVQSTNRHVHTQVSTIPPGDREHALEKRCHYNTTKQNAVLLYMTRYILLKYPKIPVYSP